MAVLLNCMVGHVVASDVSFLKSLHCFGCQPPSIPCRWPISTATFGLTALGRALHARAISESLLNRLYISRQLLFDGPAAGGKRLLNSTLNVVRVAAESIVELDFDSA